MEELKVIYLSIDKIKPDEDNAKEHPEEQVDQIKTSIEKYGMCDPIGIWGEENLIVEGHGRLLALKELGYSQAPCIRLDHLSEEERTEYALIHNQTTMNSGFNMPKLNVTLAKLNMPFMGKFGFTIPDIALPQNVEEDEEFNIDKSLDDSKPIRTQPGDIYQLGMHRLMCGDATKAEDLKLLMDGAAADLLITDPPYNVDYEGKTSDKLKIENDNMSDKDFRAFLFKAFECAKDSIKDGASFYIWHADSEGYNFRGACVDAGLTVRQCLIWKKNGMVLGRQDYQWQHEPCLYGWKSGAAHKWYSDRKQTTILEFDKPLRSEAHPTMKPVKMFAYLMQNSSPLDGIVLDTFAGSGTTVIAGEQLKRQVYAMEILPKYCDVIIDRWEELTGEKAVKIRGENIGERG